MGLNICKNTKWAHGILACSPDMLSLWSSPVLETPEDSRDEAMIPRKKEKGKCRCESQALPDQSIGPRVILLFSPITPNTFASISLRAGFDITAATIGPPRYSFSDAPSSNR